MGVGAGFWMYDVVVKSLRSLSHLLMSSCTNGRPKTTTTAITRRYLIHPTIFLFILTTIGKQISSADTKSYYSFSCAD